jgi:anti-sigma-K factor RskA
VTTSDDFGSRQSDRHVAEELLALIRGELDLDEIRVVTGHLRGCSACRQELVEVAAGIAVMRGLDDTSAEREATPAQLPLPTARRPRRSRSALLVAASIALICAGAVTAAAVFTNRNSGPQRTVAFAAIDKSTAHGSVAMKPSGSAQDMNVDTSLATVPRDHYYEVWLLDRASGKMLPVGVLPPDGRGRYRLPTTILASYDAVDISLQADNGDPKHSADSVLRAQYA